LAFQGRWRRYQELALQAFERDQQAGRRSTHVLAPPGSGKTLLGMEIVRRLGARALVLCPNSAVQAQWLRTVGLFGASDGVAAPDPDAPIACLTYQSLYQGLLGPVDYTIPTPAVVREGFLPPIRSWHGSPSPSTVRRIGWPSTTCASASSSPTSTGRTLAGRSASRNG
jgi:hypothetical protein